MHCLAGTQQGYVSSHQCFHFVIATHPSVLRQTSLCAFYNLRSDGEVFWYLTQLSFLPVPSSDIFYGSLRKAECTLQFLPTSSYICQSLVIHAPWGHPLLRGDENLLQPDVRSRKKNRTNLLCIFYTFHVLPFVAALFWQ